MQGRKCFVALPKNQDEQTREPNLPRLEASLLVQHFMLDQKFKKSAKQAADAHVVVMKLRTLMARSTQASSIVLDWVAQFFGLYFSSAGASTLQAFWQTGLHV